MRAAAPTLAALALVLAACGNGAPQPEPVRPVLTQTVVAGAAAPSDVYPGEIRARHETDVAFRVGGKLVARPVDSGARVKRGDLLARLDPEDARHAARAAAAQLAAAEGDLALAKAELERHADLLAKKFISASAFDAKRNAFNAATARAEQARSEAAIAANQAGYATLHADADGVVVSVQAEPGQVVAAGQPVLKLARSGEIEVVVSVPESQLARFKVGAPAAISLWSDAKTTFPGRIREIAGGADPATRTYAVRVAALEAPAHAQLGMTANVVFTGARDAGLVLLPLSALTHRGEAAAVWVVDRASGQVQPRAVEVAQFREDGVAIAAGLAAGDVVVTAGVHRLRSGQVVRPLPANAPGAAAGALTSR